MKKVEIIKHIDEDDAFFAEFKKHISDSTACKAISPEWADGLKSWIDGMVEDDLKLKEKLMKEAVDNG